jgi:hypothetical protein
MESIFDELEQKRLAPQNFSWAVLLCILYSIGSIGIVLVSGPSQRVFSPILLAMAVLIDLSLLRYLKNFNLPEATRWLTLKICCLFGLLVYAWLFKISLFTNTFGLNWREANVWYSRFFYFRKVIRFIALAAGFMWGLCIIRVKDDFVGLMKRLGQVIVCTAVLFGVLFFLLLYKPFRVFYNARQNQWLWLLLNVLGAVEVVVMAMIFSRAEKRYESQLKAGANQAAEETPAA